VDGRLERGESLVDVEEYLVGETARDESLPELALVVGVGVELVGVAGTRGLMTPLVFGSSPYLTGSFLMPAGPEPGTIDWSAPILPASKVPGMPPVKGSS